jgi:hypothetical protein
MIGGGINADEGSKYLQLATIGSGSMYTGLDPDDAQKGRWESEGERSKERGLSAL